MKYTKPLPSTYRMLRMIAFILIVIVAFRLFYIQIVDHKYYLLQAIKNYVVRKTIYPERGIIYDRKDKPLLINKVSFDLVVNPSLFDHSDTIVLKPILHKSGKEIIKQVRKYAREKGYYLPSIIKPYLKDEESAFFLENSFRTLAGVYLQKRSIRKYLFKEGSHVLGYVGEVDTGIINKYPNRYVSGDFAGVSGIENQYELLLAGRKGHKLFTRDNLNRIVGSLEKGKYDSLSQAGSSLTISLDIELQKLGEELMQGKIGSIVAIEPQTGEILSLISSPSFDANQLTDANRNKYYSKISKDKKLPLFNRALKGTYSPGSTIKPLMGIVGLDLEVISEKTGYPCRGSYRRCRKRITCEHSNYGHASNLEKAISSSCNSYFCNVLYLALAQENQTAYQGLSQWKNYLNIFGLGKKLNVDIPGEQRGFVPDSTYYKKYFGKVLNPCNVISLGMGQAELLLTPLQLANLTCIIANRGYYYLPHFFVSTENNVSTEKYLKPYRKKIYVSKNISLESYESIVRAMNMVVNSGTARGARIPGISICAKTGTVQNRRLINGKVYNLPSHSLFIAFAPKEDPKIAIAVIVENAGYGSRWASPIASLMIEKYLTNSVNSPYRKYLRKKIRDTSLIPEIYKTTIN